MPNYPIWRGLPGRDGAATLPAGTQGQVVGYGPDGVPRALDAAGSPYDDTGIKQRVQALEDAVPSKADVGHGHAVSAITGLQGILDGKAAVGHQHDFAAVSGLQAALDGKAPATHTHGIAGVTGLQAALNGKADATAIPSVEFLQDLVAAMFQAGTHSNASISYDDATGALNIIATGSGSGGSTLTQENVEDFVGGLVVQGTGISVTYDDAGNVLRIALAGESYTTAEKNKLAAIATGATANATDAQLRDRSTHSGTQAISTVAGLQAALDAKAATSHNHAIADVTGLQAALDALTARIAALEGGSVVTPPAQTDSSPYQPDMTTGRIAQITTSYGDRENVVPASYYNNGQDELASVQATMTELNTGM